MYRNSFIHLFLFFSLFRSSFTSNLTVYRNVGSPGGDQVENKDCDRRECEKYNLSCASPVDGGCCRCECPSSQPNYVVGKGLCKSNDEVKKELNADCKYDLKWNSGSARLADLPLTTQASGERSFGNDPSVLEVLCNHTIKAKTWENLNSFAQWQKGVGEVFSIGYRDKPIGGIDNDYQLEKLKWSGTINNQYAGSIIKINITCGLRQLGCALAKVTGQKTYDTTNVQPPPTIAPPQTTTETPPTTKGDKESYNRNQSDNTSNGVLVPVLATVGAFFVIALIIAAIMIYRRTQKREGHPGRRKDPVYAEANAGYSEYNDPALDGNNLRPHLGPLPTIPGDESPYQSLDRCTMKNKDYENTIGGFPSAADYDNPPKNSADYDKPLTQGIQVADSDYDNAPPVKGRDSRKPEYNVPPNNGKDFGGSEQDYGEDTAL